MTTKRYMQQYGRWKASYENRMAELQAIEADCILPPAIRYDRDKIQSSASGDGILKLLEQMHKREEKTQNIIKELLEKMQKFEDIVDKVEDADYKRLLHLYYIENVKPLEKVAERMGYSNDYIRHMHGDALAAVGKIVKENTK